MFLWRLTRVSACYGLISIKYFFTDSEIIIGNYKSLCLLYNVPEDTES